MVLTTADVELLRFTTAGSVDDGKSTLIGRLLYDSKTVFADQLEHVEATSSARGDERTNLALLTDGLRAEREQGITIDVAYRYFATPRRGFIIADTPGHVQYTRNMVTGASTSHLAVVLVDARNGLTEQSRRHASIASLLGIPKVVVAVNKMDLVGWSQQRFAEVRAEFEAFAPGTEATFIPISALLGDNVVEPSANMPWHDGPTLLAYLEQVPVVRHLAATGVRLPVQWVVRPQSDDYPDYRGYAGEVSGGTLRPGDAVTVLPAGLPATVASVEHAMRPLDAASPPMSVTVRLREQVDCSRGDMIAGRDDLPLVSREIDAMVCWMHDTPLQPGRTYALKHTTRNVRASVTEVVDRLDVVSQQREPAESGLALNDLGRVRLRTSAPLVYDAYSRNRRTGSFILIDEASNATVAAGMLLDPQRMAQ